MNSEFALITALLLVVSIFWAFLILIRDKEKWLKALMQVGCLALALVSTSLIVLIILAVYISAKGG